MKRVLFVIFIVTAFVAGTTGAHAQDNEPDTQYINNCNTWMSSLGGRRLEIVRHYESSSPLYRIDKVTGDVWLLVPSRNPHTPSA